MGLFHLFTEGNDPHSFGNGFPVMIAFTVTGPIVDAAAGIPALHGNAVRDQRTVLCAQLPQAIVESLLLMLHGQPCHHIELIFDQADRVDDVPFPDGCDGGHAAVDASVNDFDRPFVLCFLQGVHHILGPVYDIMFHIFVILSF